MANELKAEFETYVKNLAETICKEIYLEDLEKICNSYKDQLDECKNLYTAHADKDKELLESTERSMEQLGKLHEQISGKLAEIDDTMQHFDEECRAILQNYSAQVQSVNNDLQEEFISSFTDAVKEAKQNLTEEMAQCNRNIKESLANTITPENLEHYIVRMEESTARISEGLNLINGGYEDIFNAYKDKVSEYGAQERARFQQLIEEYVQQELQRFTECVDQTLTAQKTMLEERVPEKNMVESINIEVGNLRKDMQEMKTSYEEKLERLIKVMEKEKKMQLRLELGRRKDRRLIELLTVMNAVLLYFSIIMIALLRPWYSWGTGASVFLVVLLIAAIEVLYVWRKKRTTSLKKKAENANVSGNTESGNDKDGRENIT